MALLKLLGTAVLTAVVVVLLLLFDAIVGRYRAYCCCWLHCCNLNRCSAYSCCSFDRVLVVDVNASALAAVVL